MCGIAGVMTQDDDDFDVRSFLLDALTMLKNRGYDSAGMALLQRGEPLSLTRFASDGNRADAIDLVRERSVSANHSVGIAHTRWATHGAKTDVNSHPQMDASGKIALVHNGTIVNASDLRRELACKGIYCEGQTDTEVLTKLIGYYYYSHSDEAVGYPLEPVTLKDATVAALNRCDGTWGICVVCEEVPGEMVVACNGSPLVIGIDEKRTYVASETLAFNQYTRQFIALQDGEIGVLYQKGCSLDLSRVQVAPHQKVVLSPAPYPHWTIKECLEQPLAVSEAMNNGGRLGENGVVKLGGIDLEADRLKNIRFLTISACGTSLHAAKYGERLMKDLRSFSAVCSIDSAETSESDFFQADSWSESGLLVLSQSGETKGTNRFDPALVSASLRRRGVSPHDLFPIADVVRVVNKGQEIGMPVMSIVNVVGSLIARKTNLGVYCNAGRENAVASTKAFTTQVTVIALLALWFRQTKDRTKHREGNANKVTKLQQALLKLPGALRVALDLRDECKTIAEQLKDKEHLFCLGKGYAEPVAYEGALKIKEMCYLHAEGYSGGALKHGPFALIEDASGQFGATPVILIILDDIHADHMRTAAEEVKARGAELFIITDNARLARDLDPRPLVIPRNGPLTALGAVIPFQLIAYELAMIRYVLFSFVPRSVFKRQSD